MDGDAVEKESIDDRLEEDGQLWQLWQLQNNSAEKMHDSSSFSFYIFLFLGYNYLVAISFLCTKVSNDVEYLSYW